jgi:hypothetical protein
VARAARGLICRRRLVRQTPRPAAAWVRRAGLRHGWLGALRGPRANMLPRRIARAANIPLARPREGGQGPAAGLAVLRWGGPRRQAERLAAKIPFAKPREGPLGGFVARAPGRWEARRAPGR